MFESYKLKELGKFLKSTRINLGFTQKDVEKITGITSDSLRRVEQGQVLLRFDTLILLSMAYKKDLIEDLKVYCNSTRLLSYYTRLEDLIINYRLETLQNLRQDYYDYIKCFEPDTPINYHVECQFEKLLSGISKYNSSTPQDSLEDFIDAMRINNTLFNIYNYHQFKYTVFEMRILLLIALALSTKNEFASSNDMLVYCLKRVNLNRNSTYNEKLLAIKIYFNLSYNYHRIDCHDKAHKYSVKGIDFCNKHYISYGLATLLYRKGIAEFFLNKPKYLMTLNQSLTLLLIEEKESLAKKYIDITYKNYGIPLSLDTLCNISKN
ncbi:helix-turn-helix domain-containing protein [Alkaliphilus pronyensis]|uniref:helix-turn-helix domain-containing protein n=1 Tax=Alkaliphilus pronyensis TaxID=1482732 RepID=UPI0018658965|nr:helix-turn-helix transcriptional regulator [Alkaliphilus pronyensis]